MALLAWGASRCSICREVLDRGQAIVATTHFIADEADPLYRFSDTGMHAECFAAWEHRAEFAARYKARLGFRLSGCVPAVSAEPSAVPYTARRPVSRLMVLGAPEERVAYLSTLWTPRRSDTEAAVTADGRAGIAVPIPESHPPVP